MYISGPNYNSGHANHESQITGLHHIVINQALVKTFQAVYA